MNNDRVMLKNDILNDISRIENVLVANPFTKEKFHDLLTRAAFTELMVCLNDLLQKAKNLGVPVTFTDGIPPNVTRKDGKPVDVSDLVSMIRNAVCHISSGTGYLIKNEERQLKSTFNVIAGKQNSFIVIPGQPRIETLYEDDFSFNFGILNLYFGHHIIRSFVEARDNLLPLISSDAFTE